MSPFVSIDPAMQWGQPTLNHTRLTVAAVADLVWVEGVDVACDEYDITRADVLVACWHAGRYGLPSARRASLFPVREWAKRWGSWATDVTSLLWKASTADYDAIPDPPREAPSSPKPGKCEACGHRNSSHAPRLLSEEPEVYGIGRCQVRGCECGREAS